MTFTLLSLILIIVIFWSVLLSTLINRKSGLVKSALNLSVSVSAAILSAVLSSIIGAIFKNSAADMFYGIDAISRLYQNSGNLGDLLDIVFRMLFAACIYIPVFVTLCLVLRAVVYSIYRKRGGKIENAPEYPAEDASFVEKNDKKLGAAIGAVTGLVIAVAILSPVIGCLSSLSEVSYLSNELRDFMDDESIDTSFMDEADEYANDIIFNTVDACGAGALFDITTTVLVDGRLTNISSEMKILKRAEIAGVANAMKNITGINEENAELLEHFVDSVEEAPIVKTAVLISVKNMSDAWIEGKSYFGIERPAISGNSAANRFIDDVLRVFRTSDMDTVNKDIKTFLAIGKIFGKYSSALNSGDYEQITSALINGGVINGVKTEIRANPHMKTLEDSVDEIFMEMVSDEIYDNVKYSLADREKLFGEISVALTDTANLGDAARANYVYNEISGAFDDFGIYTTDEMMRKITDVLISDIPGDGGMVSSADVREYFDSLIQGNVADN